MTYKQSIEIGWDDNEVGAKDGVSGGFRRGSGGFKDNPEGSGSANKPNIFEYHDFRKFLADLFAFRHRLDHKFNKSFVCKKMGLINSRSYFKAVLNGRVVSKNKVEDFIRTFELDKLEAKYFRILVNFNQATDTGEEREWYFEQLQSFGGIPHRQEKQETGRTIENECHYNSIRAVMGITDFQDDFNYLVKHVYPQITTVEAEEAVRNLSRRGLIRKDERGFWKPVENLATSGH
jgi:uncharacterized protein (TIGR02147 family)